MYTFSHDSRLIVVAQYEAGDYPMWEALLVEAYEGDAVPIGGLAGGRCQDEEREGCMSIRNMIEGSWGFTLPPGPWD